MAAQTAEASDLVQIGVDDIRIPADDEAALKGVFDTYDEDFDGKLNQAEFKKLAAAYGHRLEADDLTAAFSMLDENKDGFIDWLEFIRWWTVQDSMLDTAAQMALSPVVRRMNELRKSLSKKKNLFFGFTFAQWRRSGRLNKSHVTQWTPNDVMLFVATHPDLKVIRRYMTREAFEDVDGETLLTLEASDMEALGVKSMHTRKFLRVVQELRESSALSESKSEGNLARRGSNGSRGGSAGSQSMGRLPTASTPKAPRTPGQVKRWKRGEMIGSGAFGKVFIGLNEDNGALMAVKEINFHAGNKEEVSAMRVEIELMRSLSHVNIVEYMGTQVTNGVLYIFAEWVPGGSLQSLLEKFGLMSESVVREYTRQILQGLDYLHKNKVIHRDIKGANILVDDRGTIKLADFGASKKIAEGMTAAANHTLRGTPYFMAPEVLMQTGHNHKADIWSVGGSVLEMATGEPPWKNMNFDSVFALMRHMSETSAPPAIPDHLSPELKDFLLETFRRDPAKRPDAETLLRHPFIRASAAAAPNPMLNTMRGDITIAFDAAGLGRAPVPKPPPPASDVTNYIRQQAELGRSQAPPAAAPSAQAGRIPRPRDPPPRTGSALANAGRSISRGGNGVTPPPNRPPPPKPGGMVRRGTDKPLPAGPPPAHARRSIARG